MTSLLMVALLLQAPTPERVVYNGVEFAAVGVIHASDGGMAILWTPENVEAFRAAQRAAAPVTPAVPSPAKPEPTGQAPSPAGRGMPPLPTDYGVDRSHLTPKGFSASGPQGRAYAELIEKHSAQSPESPLHLTVIGSADECRPLMADLDNDPKLARFKPSLAIQEYRPSDWAVDPNLGFKSGHPAVYIQRTNNNQVGGKVLYRSETYQGPEKLSEALRRAKPNYDPAADPGVSVPSTCPLGFKREHWPVIAGVAVLCLALFKLPHRSQA